VKGRKISITVVIVLLILENAIGQRRGFNLTEETTYFPIELYKREIYNGITVVDSITLSYHSQYLSLFKEPKLFNSKSTATLYRFTWLRSFDPPMVMTLIASNEKIELETKHANKVSLDNSYFDLEGFNAQDRKRFEQFHTGKIDSISIADLFQKGIFKKDTVKFKHIVRYTNITTQDYEDFKKLIRAKDFWNYKPMEKIDFGTDGADWILEGLSPEKGYHMVYRWSPNKNRDYDFRQICEYLIKLTGTVKKKDVY
jgi:hypothetical protein